MNLLKQALEIILPAEWLEYFEVKDIKKKSKERQITLVEKEDLIPKKLKGKEVVQNGYARPIEIMDFPNNPNYV